MGFEASVSPEAEINESIIDIKPILEQVDPIEGTFNPKEEIQRLWSVPREQRREALSVFKDKLARQMGSLGIMQNNY